MCDIITFTLYDCTSGGKGENGLLFVSITNDANTYAKIDTMVKALDSGFPFREESKTPNDMTRNTSKKTNTLKCYSCDEPAQRFLGDEGQSRCFTET